ncbi:hypothetical protein GCM10020229_49320 [Kitasatospora albolonga]|uniref:hypothetical protein n=1 Tax=Kitasatospora albolonga TaxID=68173 RepID=UPI0031EEB668
MSRFQGGPRRLLLSTDVEGYGKGDDRTQFDTQRGLVQVLGDAADAVGLARSDWIRQGAGDGELAILPADVPEAKVVDDYVAELRAALAYHNEPRRPEHRLRLRLAVHFGPVSDADNGFASQGVVLVSRLIDGAPVKRALAVARAADLVVVVSDRVYTDTVLQRHTRLAPGEFRRVTVETKERPVAAWLRVPGEDVHGLDLDGGAGPGAGSGSDPGPERGSADPAPAASAPGLQQVFHHVTAPGSVFGFGTVHNQHGNDR